MAISNINPNNINGAYPVAGQDNDTQGFRDNFTNIKTSLQFAKDEIEILLNTTVVLDDVNDMSGGTISGATIKDLRETRVALSVNTALIVLDHNAGHFYTVTANGAGAMSLSFDGWPAAGERGRVVLQLQVLNTADTLTLPASVIQGVTGLAGYDATSSTISWAREGIYEYEFTSHDGGNTFFINDLTNAKTVFNDAVPTTSTGKDGDVAGMITSDASYIYVCTADYDGSSAIWKRSPITTW